MTSDPFSVHMEAVARKVLGDPNPRLSCATELRFGQHGSMSIDLEKGVWSDHEAKVGGGVLDFLKTHKQLETGEALDWLRREVGAELEDRRQTAEPDRRSRIVATYDYADEHGEVLFQVCRMDPKDFRQRRPDGKGGWSWSVKGVRPVLYRLNEVREAVKAGQMIVICEGEKDAENGAKEGLFTTCNAGGAGKWPAELSEHFEGADVVIVPHNDPAGRNHAGVVGAALRGVASSVRVLELPGLGPKGDLSDWLATGGDAVEFHVLVERQAKAWGPEAPESRFGAIQWGDLDTVHVNYDPLIKGLIYQGDKGMVFGESGSGKSFLAVDMGLSIARGVPFLGMKCAQGSVLYQAGEGGKGLVRRLRAYRQEHQITGDVPFILLPERIDLFGQDGDTEAFIAECVAWKAALPDPLRLVVIDTFSTASPGANENDSADMGRMLAAGDQINKATGAAVLWVHHKNAAGLRERGHSSFRANIETAVEVIKDPDTKERTLHLLKLKDGEDGLKLGFELQSVTLGSDDDGDPITSCVVRPVQLGTAQTGKRAYLPKGQFDFLKVLDSAISHRGGVIPGHSHYGAEYEAFRDLYVSLKGQGKTSGAIRQAISRDGDALWRSGLIEREDRWLWITDKGGEYIC